MEPYKMIDYDHQQGGPSCNGNLSNMEGAFEAYWTFEQQGRVATEEPALTAEAFGLLWDGIAVSVSGGGVFWRCLVTDPTRLIGPDLHHVITTTQVQDGRLQHRTFMVPLAETDPAFAAWMDTLAVPSNAWCDDAKAARRGQAAAKAGYAEAAGERNPVLA